MIHLVVIKSIRACNRRFPYCYYINDDTPEYECVIATGTIERIYSTPSTHLDGRKERGFIWLGGEPLMLGQRKLGMLLDLQKQYFEREQIVNLLRTQMSQNAAPAFLS